MPKKPPQEIKKLIHIRLSPDSLSYIKQLAETTRRDLTNVIEYLIYLHSNKQLKEPIPYFTNKESVKTQPKTQEHKPEPITPVTSNVTTNDSQKSPEPFNDTIVERPFDD